MTVIDWLIVAGYFAAIAALTSWVMKRRRDTADDYFLASRHLGWFVVGASIFASNIGSEHLVGLAGAGATSGVALAHYELHAWGLLVLGCRLGATGSPEPGPRSRRPRGSQCASTATTRGSACCSARRSSACGTGPRTSTSCSARWGRGTSARRGGDRSAPRS